MGETWTATAVQKRYLMLKVDVALRSKTLLGHGTIGPFP
jgi:hypothetical protein